MIQSSKKNSQEKWMPTTWTSTNQGTFPVQEKSVARWSSKSIFKIEKIRNFLNIWKMFTFPLRCSPARINKPPTTQSKNSSQDKILTSLTTNYDHHSDLWWSSYCVKIITLSHNHQHAVLRWSSYSIKRSILKLLTAPNELLPKSKLEFLWVQMIMFNSAVS